MSDDSTTRTASAKRPALGRGLGALLGETRREEPLVTPAQPRPAAGTATPTAGLAMLELVQAPGFYTALEAKTNALCDGLEAAARDAGVPFSTQRVGGMFGLFFSADKVDTYAGAMACDTAAFNRFFHEMLGRGVFLAPSAFEAGFISSAHDDAVIAQTIDAARAAFHAL